MMGASLASFSLHAMRSFPVGDTTMMPLRRPLLNGVRHALRPVVTAADQLRYRERMPAIDGIDPDNGILQARRIDLIEDRLQGGIIGSACVVRSGRRLRAYLRLEAMQDRDPIRADVLRLLADALPELRRDAAFQVDTALVAEPEDTASALRSMQRLQLAEALGIPDDYASRHALSWIDEPARLHYADRDYVGRTLWLQHAAAQAWQAMRRAAGSHGVRLEAVSGFRSIAYQAGILRRKLARGMAISEVLAINTAPGYSEHHSGRAIDIGTPGYPPAEEVFESTPAFAWLREHAVRFGFRMSYPRDNPHGVVYEPWHWYHLGR